MTTENDTTKNTNQINPLLVSENIQPNRELIDDCFYVEQKKWGTWDSYDKEGKCIITSLSKEVCINATRFHLKGLQEGFLESIKTHEGAISGKL
jgi:hypothetical protein